MSCNGCRVLRKGCSDSCVLRSCLQWIPADDAQGHATLFLSKFFGRSDLFALVAAVPDSQRPALFRSLLFEACGRTVNPVSGAVGLLSTGNWHVCDAAVETVLSGGVPHPVIGGFCGDNTFSSNSCGALSSRSVNLDVNFPVHNPNLNAKANWPGKRRGKRSHMTDCWATRGGSLGSDISEVIDPGKGSGPGGTIRHVDDQEIKLLNLFV